MRDRSNDAGCTGLQRGKGPDGKHHFAALHSGNARTPISVAPLRNAVSLWLAPSGIKSASSKLCPAASLAVATPTSVNGSQGSHGALNAEAYSSTMVQFSRARSSPSQKPFSRRAFDLSAYRIIGCHDSADGVSQQASPISGLFVDFDFEARIQACHSGAMAKLDRTARAIAGPRAFNGLCDDEGMPLICPTCQVLGQSVRPGDRLLLCMGLFSIFLVGSHRDAARRPSVWRRPRSE